VRDPEARYWGGRVDERSLVPLGEARIGRIGLDEWLRRSHGANERVTMTTRLVALISLCLMTATSLAQPPTVTTLMSKDLPENPGKELLMITVEHAPGGSSPVHRHNAHAMVYMLEGSAVMAGSKVETEVTLTPGQASTKALTTFISSTGTRARPSGEVHGGLDQGEGTPALVPSGVSV
jgi:hypothetical protein